MSNVSIKIVDLSGKSVLNLQSGKVSAGKQSINADVSGLSKGVYIINAFIEGNLQTKKLVIE